jgi:hypothetical protein
LSFEGPGCENALSANAVIITASTIDFILIKIRSLEIDS